MTEVLVFVFVYETVLVLVLVLGFQVLVNITGYTECSPCVD